MWGGSNKVWLQFRKDIIAADNREGAFLVEYLRYTFMTKSNVHALEIADLQQYKILKQPAKIKTALAARFEIPFVFIMCKN